MICFFVVFFLFGWFFWTASIAHLSSCYIYIVTSAAINFGKYKEKNCDKKLNKEIFEVIWGKKE